MLPPERTGRAAPADLRARREGLRAAAAAGTWRTARPAVEIVVGGVRVLRFDPPGPPRATIVHVHGGAFRIGCPEQVGPFAAALAARCGVTVICPAYRLAPEYPFPAALADGARLLAALPPGRLILSGDSAGGALAAGLAPGAAGLLLFSPWLDLTVTRASFDAHADSDPLFSEAAAREAAELYLQGWNAHDPHASPLFAEAARFPPTFVSVGAGEVLADDARAFHAHLTAAGVPAILDVVAGMDHVAVTRGLDLPGAAATLDAAARFVETLV